jgi:signal transduction histidine kinase/CheY-like chemotaxis protein
VTVWGVVDLAAAASLCALLWMMRGLEAPPRIQRLILPCLGGGTLFVLGDFGTRALASSPAGHFAALLVLYGGYMTLPPSWFLLSVYVAELAGSRLAARISASRWRYAPALFAGAAFAAVSTNPWHGAFFAITPGVPVTAPRALFWVHEVFAYLLLGLAALLSAFIAVRALPVVRQHPALVGMTLTALWLCGLFLPRIAHQLDFDPAILGIAISGTTFVGALASQRFFLLRALPFAEVRAQDPNAVLLIDRFGLLVDANAPARQLLGARLEPPHGVVARLGEALHPLDDAQPAGTRLVDAIAAGTGAPGLRCELAGTPRRIVRVTTTLLREPLGQRSALLVRIHDETALFEAERRSAEQAALLDVMWGLTGDAVVVVDRERRVRYANAALARLWGTTRAALEGLTAAELVEAAPVELRAPGRDTLRAVDRDFLSVFEDELQLQDGRILRRTAQPLFRDGDLFGRFTRFCDITEERRSAEALRDAAKLESLSVLAGGVAHDFNNLLTTILGSAELATREVPAQGRTHALLEDLRDAALRGGDLASQLLAYAGRAQRKLQVLDVSELVDGMTSLLSAAVPPRIAIERALARDLLAVRGDAGQLTQVVMNLVLNAAESIGEKPGRITLETLAADGAPGWNGPRPHVALRVSDDGAGMSAETRTRIFDPFFTTKPTGRGLGLASVHGIVSQHGGSIHVESEPGNGATFTVFLPATRRPAESSVPAPSGEPETPRLGGRMLIVDDDPATLRTSRLLAESLGFEVTTAGRPSEALATAQAREFRIALIDATMPEASGPQLLAMLRQRDPALPAIVYSGFARESIALPSSPPTEFLGKPFRRATFEAAVLRVLHLQS